MFGLFTPKCPLDTAEKTWVERRMLWFVERFGIDRLRNARVVTPTNEFLPDVYTADHTGVRQCLDRMCGYMGIDPDGVTLELLPDHLMPAAAGLYEMRAKGHIRIAESQLADPPRLMATIVHELAHEILLRGEHLTGYEADHETTTDLFPVFLGVGIFGANATVREGTVREGNLSWWLASKHGYLSSLQLGYAMALFAYARGEVSPEWRHHLRTDARKTLTAGLRFLRKTGDSLFTPDTAAAQLVTPTAERALARLAMRSPTFRLSALWDISEFGLTGPELLNAVVEHLEHPDDTLRTSAAQAVTVFGAEAHVAVPRLLALLNDEAVRATAAQSLGVLSPPAKDVVPELNRLLLSPDAATEAASALRLYRGEATSALPNLLTALEHAIEARDARTVALLSALRAISPDPQKAIRAHFGSRYPDLLRLALHELKRGD